MTEQDAEQKKAQKIEEKRQRAERARELLARLAERYPNCFTSDPARIRPLAIGIQQALRADLANDPELQDTPGWLVRQALAQYVRRPRYLKAIVEKQRRVNLDGSDAGEVDDQQQAHAEQQLAEIEARRAARKPQRPRRAPRKRETDEDRTRRKLEQLAAKYSKN